MRIFHNFAALKYLYDIISNTLSLDGVISLVALMQTSRT
jgi:hypothetical protein